MDGSLEEKNMMKANEVSLQASQTKTTKPSENFTIEEFGQAVRMLLAYGKNAPTIGSTDFKIWHRSISATFSFQELKNAVLKLENHTGYLDLGTLREYCRATRPSRSTVAIEHKGTQLTADEKRRRIKEMRERLNI